MLADRLRAGGYPEALEMSPRRALATFRVMTARQRDEDRRAAMVGRAAQADDAVFKKWMED